ncbi:MAG: peptidoglycan-binding protein, partial [Clostridia bacterium]|nr:peptidoglycan-binding protein [Clostridia bacterium]
MNSARIPVIPERITVHLGAPDSDAQNVTISFADYIANVASSEIFPTWPENAIRANIYAQISFALNRIYTEYYRARGYDFDITNDIRFDQSFVNGREYFENIGQLADELFTSYIRRQGSVEPLFAQYCDGVETTCQGLSQWGTVALAEEGLTPFEILQKYYGDDIGIVTDTPVESINASAPEIPLRLGSGGDDVRSIQLRLNRISDNYPSIPKIAIPDGVFSYDTEDAVKRFQEIFSLTPDGIVGTATWYRIQLIYNAVKRLNELDSEGIKLGEVTQQYERELSIGDTGVEVNNVQYLIAYLAQFYNTIPSVAVDGIFGIATEEAVKDLQRTFERPVTGAVDYATWDIMYRTYIG